MLAEHYIQLRMLHVASVAISGTLFALRGLLIQSGHCRLAQSAAVRYLSYGIDTVLLASALLLVAILPWAMFSNGWLVIKLALLVVYVLLGTFALKRGRTRRVRRVCYVAALATFVLMVGVAIAHQPLGWLYIWLS
ncbi:MAG: SirB2 family protein [Rhodanobacteraceae bacterium]